MKNELEGLKKQAISDIHEADSLDFVQEVENKYFGRKDGQLNNILKGLKALSVEEKKVVGSLANEIKTELLGLIEKKLKEIKNKDVDQELHKDWLDVTLPASKNCPAQNRWLIQKSTKTAKKRIF